VVSHPATLHGAKSLRVRVRRTEQAGDRARRRACESGDSENSASLLTELDAFYTEHRCCGDPDAGVDGAIVWNACDCGASMARRVDEGDALAFDG
jgi:hypothetical protein